MRNTYVPPRGPRDAKLGVCGEQPGVQEVRWNPPTPFVGPAGKGQDSCMVVAGISRKDCYLTNVIKDLDAPLAKYINLDSRGNYKISEDGWTYINELGDELRKLNLNVIVAYGNIALIALTNRVGITKWRGSVLDSTLVPGLKVVPTFHPSTFIPPKLNFLNKPLICFDLKRAKYESQFKELKRETRNVKIRPSFGESRAILRNAYEQGLRGNTIDLDIEVINEELDCISIAVNPHNSVSIPFRFSKGDYFTPEQEYEIMLLIEAIMSEKRISKRGANFIFDMQFLFSKYGIVPRGEIHCTQIAQKISFPDYAAGLDFVTTMHTDIPYYKVDGKKWMKAGVGSWEEWWNYNGMDTIATAAAHPCQMEDLRRQGNIETYDRQRKLIKPLIYMMERGIRIDVEGMVKERDTVSAYIDNAIEELHRKVGYELNYNSSLQLQEYFYKKLKHKPYKKRSSKGEWVDTCNEDAMKRLARKGFDEARMVLDLRRAKKRLSTYLNIKKVDKDGRYRSSYKPVGAETGRLSSGETIFGSGGNQQNWPHDLLRFFLFDEGYIGYSFDSSQIENRIVAYVGGIIPMIEAFESGKDIHRLTASMFLRKPYDEVSDEDGSSSLGDGRQSERFWGKKGNHAINYDYGYKSFALEYETTESEAKYIIESIHAAYPQIRQGYHPLIQGMLKRDRTITNLFGRKRVFMGPVIPLPPQTPLHACLATYRKGYAHLPQSTTADKINEHGINYIYYNQDLFKPVEILAQIHDSIVFQIHLSTPWKQHAEILLNIQKSLETPVYWRDTKIVIPADLCIGMNMCKKEMIELKSKSIPQDTATLADRLEKIYHDLSRSSHNTTNPTISME
jgi:uracil-DNA glycosylase family 4